MRIEVQEAARSDLVEGFWFYERQQPGLGGRFVAEMEHEIESLIRVHEIKRKVHGEIRRHLARQFPWAIFFVPVGDTIHVLAVIDCRRNPAFSQHRFGVS